MLEAIPKIYVSSTTGRHMAKQEKSLPPNITHKESHQAQLINRNLDVVEQVIAEAKLGEMLEAIPKKGMTKELTSHGGRKHTLPPNITHKESHQAQLINNLDILTPF